MPQKLRWDEKIRSSWTDGSALSHVHPLRPGEYSRSVAWPVPKSAAQGTPSRRRWRGQAVSSESQTRGWPHRERRALAQNRWPARQRRAAEEI